MMAPKQGSKPAYGGVGAYPMEAVFARRQRQRMNIVAICLCLFLPWILFCLVYAVTSFHLHYSKPWLCWSFVAAAAFLVLCVGVSAGFFLRAKLRDDDFRQPSWLVFMSLSLVVALAFGAILGNLNFWNFMRGYYDYLNLNDYNYVNVAAMRGQQLMDAGRIDFLSGTKLDLTKAMSFRNMDTYCVAPLSLYNKKGGKDDELGSYDFWAVGLNCCEDVDTKDKGQRTDFKCGEYNNPAAHGGLRLLEDDPRPFYRLAVQQAEAMYHIKATHPLFVYWTDDPAKEMESWREDGAKFFIIAMIVHFVFQLLCVLLATFGFRKLGQY